MVCKKCKHEIGPEELKCPYCGAENPFAKRHAKNMRKFNADFTQTERKVTNAAEKTGGLAKRAAILVLVIVACFVLVIIDSFAYANFGNDNSQKTSKNGKASVAEAEALLEQGEYIEFVEYLNVNSMMSSSSKETEHLKHVKYVAGEYYDCIREMESMILRSTDPDYFDSLDGDISNFCMDLEAFYDVIEAQRDGEDNEEYKAYIEDMDNELKAAMKTYFSMDDAAVEEFLSLSRNQKGVKIEEVLRHE